MTGMGREWRAGAVREVAEQLGRILDAEGGRTRLRQRDPRLQGAAALLAPRGAEGGEFTLVCPAGLLRQVMRQMDLTILRERWSGLDRVFDLSCSAEPMLLREVKLFQRCHVSGERCRLDGRDYAISRGNWAFYVPRLGAKILHAREGRRWCFHETRPAADLLDAGDGALALGPYSLDDWRRALAVPVLRRTAENYVSARRLAAVAAGPAVGRGVVIRELTYDEGGAASASAGFEVADLTRYLRREPATEADLARAGVRLDRIASALRQQINGYVSDLDSVVGVAPVASDDAVRKVEARLAQALGAIP